MRRYAAVLLALLMATPAFAREHWTEYNIGPFYITTDSDDAAARAMLVQLEQMRWVLGNLLESKDLRSLWPIRILLTRTPVQASQQFVLRNGEYVWAATPDAKAPLGEVAGMLLDANMPRLPAEIESGMRGLLSTLSARGSRVEWGSAPAHPDLAWARMQLFATKFEYGASFHIFLAALRDGSTLAAAERNAYAKTPAQLEAEANANLAAGNWQAVPVSGRPLDPKRDFGVHLLNDVVANVYLAPFDAAHAEASCKAAVEFGGDAAPLGYACLGELAKAHGEDAKLYWQDAVRAGSRSAPVYVAAADGLPGVDALPLLKRAAQLNDRWAEPLYREAEFADTPAEKEALLKTALALDPRNTAHWIELAKLQTNAGEATAAQGTWLRAQNSAPDDSERERVHQLARDSEQQRLDAAEAADRRERNAVHLADEQAHQAEMARIHAAEQKANRALDRASGGEQPANVVSWDALAGAQKLSGTLIGIDCLKDGWRLAVKSKGGSITKLFLAKTSGADLSCSPHTHPRRIALQYRAMIDDVRQTSGEVTSLTLE